MAEADKWGYVAQLEGIKPPTSVKSWARREFSLHAAVYSLEWVDDTWLGGAKKRMVRVHCCACDADHYYEYAKRTGRGAWYDKTVYGWHQYEDGEEITVREGDRVTMQCCETNCRAIRASTIRRNGGNILEKGTVTTGALLKRGSELRPALALLQWYVRRIVRYEREMDEAVLYKADVFEERGRKQIKGGVLHRNYYGDDVFKVQGLRLLARATPITKERVMDDGALDVTKELVEGSCLENCKADLMATKRCCLTRYIMLYQAHRNIENLAMQAPRLLASIISENAIGERIEWQLTRPGDMLGLSREELRRAREEWWTAKMLRAYLAERSHGRMQSAEVLRWAALEAPGLIGKGPLDKIKRYLEKQKDNAIQLGDYWSNAEKAGWDLNDPAIRWPQRLKTMHDRAMAAAKTEGKRAIDEKIRARAAELAKWGYFSGGLMIFPASGYYAMQNEGKMLNHCVETYADRVAEGKTDIFFIRRTSDPLKPYYTLELDEGKMTVRQNRGKRNCERTPEVQKFEDEWMEWIKAGAKREKRCRVPVGARHVEIAENLKIKEDKHERTERTDGAA